MDVVKHNVIPPALCATRDLRGAINNNDNNNNNKNNNSNDVNTTTIAKTTLGTRVGLAKKAAILFDWLRIWPLRCLRKPSKHALVQMLGACSNHASTTPKPYQIQPKTIPTQCTTRLVTNTHV